MAGKPVTDAEGGDFDIPDDQGAANAPPPAAVAPAPAPSSWSDALGQFMQNQAQGIRVSPYLMGAAMLMDPSQDMQNRVSMAKDLPAQAPAAPSTPNQGTQGQTTGYQPPHLPDMPAVPHLGMPGFDFKGSQGRIDDATAQKAQGVQDAAKAEAQAAQIRAQSKADIATQQQQYFQQSQAARDAAYQQVQSQQARVQQMMDDLDKQQVAKMDPNHFWATRSNAQQAAAALGTAFAQIGSAFTGQKPLDLISGAIDRDIEAQRQNIQTQKDMIANKRANLGMRSNLLEQNYRIFGNHQDAADMTKAHMFDALAAQGEAQAQQAANPAIQARALQQTGQLRAQAEQLRQGTWARQSDMAYKNNMLAMEQYKAQQQAAELKFQMQRAPYANGVINVGGQDVPLPPNMKPEQVESLRNIATAHSVVTDRIAALKKLLQENPAEFRAGIGSTDRRRQLGLDDILLNYGASQGHTQQTPEPVLERFNEALKAPGTVSNDDYAAMLNELQAGADNGSAAAFHFYRLPGPADLRMQQEAQKALIRQKAANNG